MPDLAKRESNDDLLAILSHEIRAPLCMIVGMTECIAGLKDRSEIDRKLRSIQRAAQTLLGILENILSQRKIESGKLELSESDFDLKELLDEVVDLFKWEADRKGIELRAGLHSRKKRVRADRTRLMQVLVNLVGNAVKFTDVGKVEARLRLIGDHHAPWIAGSVVDTGIGIETEMLSRIFDPFSQGGPSIARRYGGTGLGLSISKGLVMRMGGGLDVKSAPGAGSEFCFRIPVRSAKSHRTPAFPRRLSEASAIGLRPPKILLIEDGEENRYVLSRMLEALGMDSDVVESGRDALHRLGSENYDLLLVDCRLSDCDGCELTRRIRDHAQENRRDLPIVGITADATFETRVRCLAAGMDDCVPKPLRQGDLHRIIERWTTYPVRNPVNAELRTSPETVRQFATIFARLTPERLTTMRDCARSGDFESVSRIAHALRASCAFMDQSEATAICVTLETKTSQMTSEAILQLIRDLESGFAVFKQELETSSLVT